MTAETCSHYLSLTDQDVLANGPLFKCAPPLRSKEDVDRLWDLCGGRNLQRHSKRPFPCSYDEKFREILGNKIENVFDVWGRHQRYPERISGCFQPGVRKARTESQVLARAMALNPAEGIWHIRKKRGYTPGFDADLVILDPEKEWGRLQANPFCT